MQESLKILLQQMVSLKQEPPEPWRYQLLKEMNFPQSF